MCDVVRLRYRNTPNDKRIRSVSLRVMRYISGSWILSVIIVWLIDLLMTRINKSGKNVLKVVILNDLHSNTKVSFI